MWPLASECATVTVMKTAAHRPGSGRAVRRRAAALAVAVTALTAPALVAESILINEPVLGVPSREVETFLDAQFVRAAAAAQDTYGGLTVGYDGFQKRLSVSQPSVRIDVVATDSGGQTVLVLNASNDSGGNEAFAYQLPWHDALYREIAAMIGYFNAVLGEQSQRPESEVVYFQDFHTDFIANGDLPVGSIVQPYSVTSRDGNLLVASGTFVLETDRYFREQAKIGLGSDVPGYWAMHVGATPAGTIAAASAAQGGIVKLVPGIPSPYRFQTRNPVMNFALGSDGTAFTLDMQQSFLRFGSDGAGPLDLGLPEGTFVSFMAAGPENTLMVWEPTMRSVLIFDSEGTRVGMVVPHVPFDVALGMKHFQPYENGDILAVFNDRIMRFARDGSVVWELLADDVPEIGGLMLFTEAHLEPSDGTIYLLSIQSKRIVQLIDLAEIRSQRRLTATERSILESNEALRDNPYDQRALAARARIYEGIDAWEAAAYSWETAYGINPTAREIADAREEVSLRRLEENAGRLYEQAVRLLDQYGTASAAYAYQQAQSAFERLIARAPRNDDARGKLDELRRRFEDAQSPSREAPPLSVDNVAIADLFPSLFTRYQSEPAGTVTVTNTGERALTSLEVTAQMRFLEFETPGETLARLAPGESATLALRLPISSETLTLQESTPVPVNVTVSFRGADGESSVSRLEIITVHRATALTWNESAKLVAYITPRDAVVESYAAPYVAIGGAERIGLSEKIFRAARISDAVAASGLEYIEDPDSGITDVLGNPSVIDTVRFPRTTMRVGYGDCDDTTALLASLLESVGIATAVMTSPGHVFLAFDTGEPEQNRWLFESETTTAIAHGGTVWLPYETTILDEGFLASWEEGSRLYKRYSPDGSVEFIPVSAQRSRFPALPLAPASFSIAPPPQALVDPRYDASVSRLRETLYVANVARLEASLPGAATRARVRTLNQIGILHGQFDERRRARSSFEEAIEADPDYAASYVNLANLSLIEGEPAEALAWIEEAEARRPGGIITTLLRAQAEYLSGNREAASEQMTILQTRAPDLAAQYPHLSGDSGTGRASEARARAVLPWAVE